MNRRRGLLIVVQMLEKRSAKDQPRDDLISLSLGLQWLIIIMSLVTWFSVVYEQVILKSACSATEAS